MFFFFKKKSPKKHLQVPWVLLNTSLCFFFFFKTCNPSLHLYPRSSTILCLSCHFCSLLHERKSWNRSQISKVAPGQFVSQTTCSKPPFKTLHLSLSLHWRLLLEGYIWIPKLQQLFHSLIWIFFHHFAPLTCKFSCRCIMFLSCLHQSLDLCLDLGFWFCLPF